MSEYTPTTERVLIYIRSNAVLAGASAEEAQLAAMSWLAEVERAAAARALDEAADKFSAEDDPEWGFWQDYDGWSRDPSEPLRARAAEIREKGRTNE